jgi:hypothetical protein
VDLHPVGSNRSGLDEAQVALLELARERTPADLAGGFGPFPRALSVPKRHPASASTAVTKPKQGIYNCDPANAFKLTGFPPKS